MVKLKLKENERIVQVETLTNKNLYFKYTIGKKKLDDIMNTIFQK